MTLRIRLALISAAAVALAVAVASITAFAAIRREVISEIDDSLVERAELIGQFPEVGIDFQRRGAGAPRGFFLERGRRGDPLGRAEAGFDALYVQFVDAQGTAYAPAAQNLVLPVAMPELEVITGGADRVLRTVSVDDVDLRMITVASPIGAVQLARSLEEARSVLRGLAVAQWIAGLVGIVVAAVLGLIVARSALRPVSRLTDAVEHVAATKELEKRIEVDRRDEIGRLATSFNEMLSALEASRAQQHRLVRDASHELRTPLTSLRTNMELLAKADDFAEAERIALLEDVRMEMVELSALVEELVDLATESHEDEQVTVGLRLDELVDAAASRYRRRTGQNIVVTVEPCTVDGRPQQLERAVGNLLDNAAKWSSGGASISVTVGSGRVVVTDEGPGIAEEDRPFIWDRFYRADTARAAPGSGLGLSIVKKIVEEHGGTVFVGDSDRGGAVIGFELPISTTQTGSWLKPVLT